MKKIIRFLGSALFAVLLLFLTGLLVALGTFLESKTGSHLLAMQAVYSSWLFRLLLGGFFINILVSALMRYPFKAKHIPFLITHIGLLMIISGLFVKNIWGLQGMVIVPAGSERSIAFIPELKELVIETKDGKFEFDADISRKKEPFFDDGKLLEYPEVRVLDSSPHSQLVVDSFFKGDVVDIMGLHPFPVFNWKEGEPLPLSGKIRMGETVFNVIAIRTKDAVTHPKTITLYRDPLLLFIQDDQETHVIGVDEKGQVQKTSLGKRCEGGQLLAYDDGFSGYGVQLPFPCPLYGPDEPLPLSWPLCHELLKTLSQAGCYLHDSRMVLPEAVKEALEKSAYFEERPELAKGLTLAALMVDEVLGPESESVTDAFKKRDFPFLRKVAFDDDAQFLASLVEMCMSIDYFCPVASKAKLTSLLLRIYQRTPLEKRPLLETKLAFRWKKDPGHGVNPEDLAPLYLLEINQERGLAALDPAFTNTCSLGKIYLKPLSYQIPYSVRVQDAREISYPGTNQAQEYECAFYLTDRRTGEVSLQHIGMNRVFETDDGYRFFLSNIHPSDESAPQEVRLALNYDPSRRLLIYIGGILVAIGIVLLYFFVIKKNR